MTKAKSQPSDTNGKKGTREDNKNILHYYLKSNPIQRAYRKRINECWAEFAKFNKIDQ